MELENIINVATVARGMLEEHAPKCPIAQYPPMWNQFPTGCCGDASDILAVVFCQLGAINVSTVCGYFQEYTGASHAWVQVDDIIVDITGDQFNHLVEVPLPAIFVSNSRQWHDRNFVGQGKLDTPDKWIYLRNNGALEYYQMLGDRLKIN